MTMKPKHVLKPVAAVAARANFQMSKRASQILSFLGLGGLPAGSCPAASIEVNSAGDTGSGTLREAVQNAQNGDVI